MPNWQSWSSVRGDLISIRKSLNSSFSSNKLIFFPVTAVSGLGSDPQVGGDIEGICEIWSEFIPE